jgi:hypothetical protein
VPALDTDFHLHRDELANTLDPDMLGRETQHQTTGGVPK